MLPEYNVYNSLANIMTLKIKEKEPLGLPGLQNIFPGLQKVSEYHFELKSLSAFSL